MKSWLVSSTSIVRRYTTLDLKTVVKEVVFQLTTVIIDSIMHLTSVVSWVSDEIQPAQEGIWLVVEVPTSSSLGS